MDIFSAGEKKKKKQLIKTEGRPITLLLLRFVGALSWHLKSAHLSAQPAKGQQKKLGFQFQWRERTPTDKLSPSMPSREATRKRKAAECMAPAIGRQLRGRLETFDGGKPPKRQRGLAAAAELRRTRRCMYIAAGARKTAPKHAHTRTHTQNTNRTCSFTEVSTCVEYHATPAAGSLQQHPQQPRRFSSAGRIGFPPRYFFQNANVFSAAGKQAGRQAGSRNRDRENIQQSKRRCGRGRGRGRGPSHQRQSRHRY